MYFYITSSCQAEALGIVSKGKTGLGAALSQLCDKACSHPEGLAVKILTRDKAAGGEQR